VRPDAVKPEKVDDKKSFFMHADVTLAQNRKLGVSLFGTLTELLETGDLMVCIAVRYARVEASGCLCSRIMSRWFPVALEGSFLPSRS